MIDIQGAIPVFIDITHARVADVLALDKITLQPGSYVVMDRGYIDFQRLYHLNQTLVFFVIRARGDLQYRRRFSHPVDKSTGLRSDQTPSFLLVPKAPNDIRGLYDGSGFTLKRSTHILSS
jgi:hypothetical protein